MSDLMFYFQSKFFWINVFGPIQDRREVEGKKVAPIRFFPVNSPKGRNSPQNFLTFSFNTFSTLL